MDQQILTTRLVNLLLFCIIVVLVHSASCGSEGAFETASIDSLVVRSKELIPEGIAVNKNTGEIYLSSLHQNKIVVVDNNGVCKDLIASGQGGFMKGIGIKITADGKTLWACSATLDTIKSSSALFHIDLATGAIIDSIFYTSDSSSLFNDIAIHSNGDIYLTDTFLGSIFRYRPSDKQLERWLSSEQLSLANGIALSDDSILFVASGNKGIQRVNLRTKEISSVSKGERTDYAVDGLVYHNKSLYGVIGWPQEEPQNHRIIRYRLTEDYFLSSVDTIVIKNDLVKVPTTAAMHDERLFVLSKTNLGYYNAAKQSLNGVEDSLEFPVILKLKIDNKKTEAD